MTLDRSPVLAHTGKELQELLSTRERDAEVGLVPTMGALHAGHAALLKTARARIGDRGRLVASIFVNPLQFGPGEDLDRYPRTLDADLEVCAAHDVDVVFAPSAEEVYPGGEPEITVSPGRLGDVLEGAARPGHFRGVLTVVVKLFGLVRPAVAVFGEKDDHQLVLVQRMASDLCLGVRVIGAATVRERDGLALSSRNAYLSSEDRRAALVLSRALSSGASQQEQGAGAVLEAARGVLSGEAGVEADYLELIATDLGPPPDVGDARLLVAARVGNTRLIDNMALTLGPTSPVTSAR